MESLKLAEGNGVTSHNVFGKNEKRAQDKAIASVYFKFSHQDQDGELISNVDQIKIIEEIVSIIKNHIKNRNSSNQLKAFTGTKLNHFDVLEQNIRQNQAICSASDKFNTAFKENFLQNMPIIKKSDATTNFEQKFGKYLDNIKIGGNKFIQDTDFLSKCIPDFKPVSQSISGVVDEAAIRLVSFYLPPMTRMQEWKKLFSISEDGSSINTFYNKVDEHEETVIFIQDENNNIFGCFMIEPWKNSRGFYGSGYQSFLFKLERTKQDTQNIGQSTGDKYLTTSIQVYDPKYTDNHFQHSDDRSITLGGGDNSGSSIYITNFFKEGYTGESETYNNPQLTDSKDFKVLKFEVWGFDTS